MTLTILNITPSFESLKNVGGSSSDWTYDQSGVSYDESGFTYNGGVNKSDLSPVFLSITSFVPNLTIEDITP